MSFKGKFEHTASLFTAFNILLIDQVNSYMCLIYVYQCLKNESDNTFLPYIPIHYQTRIQLQLTCNCKFKNSLSYVVKTIFVLCSLVGSHIKVVNFYFFEGILIGYFCFKSDVLF